jgi:hypothetical protein
MRRRAPIPFLALCLAVLAAACESSAGPVDEFTASDVPGADLPAADLSRTWKYTQAEANADSLVRVLLAARVGLEEAWQPLEDLCEDPIGPRFTVLLGAPDPTIAKYGFEPGNGIRACTVLVRRYVPVR